MVGEREVALKRKCQVNDKKKYLERVGEQKMVGEREEALNRIVW